jgi:hypothetical protein
LRESEWYRVVPIRIARAREKPHAECWLGIQICFQAQITRRP